MPMPITIVTLILIIKTNGTVGEQVHPADILHYSTNLGQIFPDLMISEKCHQQNKGLNAVNSVLGPGMCQGRSTAIVGWPQWVYDGKHLDNLGWQIWTIWHDPLKSQTQDHVNNL